jgi:hypothetical protein
MAKSKTKIKEYIATFLIAITCSEFGNLQKFYKTYAKGNREIIIEGIEYEGTDEQHNTGLIIDKFTFKVRKDNNYYPDLQKAVEDFLDKNNLHQECFSITREGSKKVLFTEDDF